MVLHATPLKVTGTGSSPWLRWWVQKGKLYKLILLRCYGVQTLPSELLAAETCEKCGWGVDSFITVYSANESTYHTKSLIFAEVIVSGSIQRKRDTKAAGSLSYLSHDSMKRCHQSLTIKKELEQSGAFATLTRKKEILLQGLAFHSVLPAID